MRQSPVASAEGISSVPGGEPPVVTGTAGVQRPGLLRRARLIASGAVAAFLGLLPHILHHAGPLAGAALFAGAGGSLLFGAIGLAAAIPFLRRIRRRTGGWRAPAGVLALMAVTFTLSTLVIGPQISGASGDSSSDASATPASSSQQDSSPAPTESESAHESHH